MPVVTLRDLYVDELTDLLDAEQQVLQELPGMAARATSAELRKAFEEHYEQTQVHLERLELLFRQLNERPRLQPCEAVRGLVQQAHRRAAAAERGETLDATLIAEAQRIEHYGIAAYGCARTYARILGDAEAARLLQQSLDDEWQADRRLTAIAMRGINDAASEDVLPNATTYRSRLRYVDAADLPRFRYRAWRITTIGDEDDLGTIDGFIVDGESGRPVYYVVDSGGWFTGRRYVIPVAQLALDEAGTRFRTELTRDQLRRYPEFSAGAFIAMDDEDATRYERRLIATVLPFRQQPQARTAGERPKYDDLPLYQPPGWLMSGVWATEASGFAAVPPRSGELPRRPATRDDKSEREHEQEAAARPENELMVARGEPDGRSERAQSEARPPKRIEKYRER
jgi:ferritin-like metal-binding protein YciE